MIGGLEAKSYLIVYFHYNILMRYLVTAIFLMLLMLFGSISFSANNNFGGVSKKFTDFITEDKNFQIGKSHWLRREYDEALAKWLPLAKNGRADAQTAVAQMYQESLGVRQDFNEAAKWYRKAALQGDSTAQMKLGFMYKKGQGVAREYKEAVKWFSLSANQENMNSQVILGDMYYQGLGVKLDYKKAHLWFLRAAEHGHPDAQAAIGAMYVFGHGVLKNIVRAHMWANVGAANGSKYGRLLRAKLQKEMTELQIKKALSLAKKCFHKRYKGCDF